MGLFKSKKIFSLIFATLFLVASAGLLIADQSKVPLVGGGQAYKPLDEFLIEGEIIGGVAGDSWYVDSGKSASGDGKSWDYAVITWDEANNLATASNGDVIHVAPGHAETIDAATDMIPDKAGITTIGYGEGRLRPTFSWADAAAANIPVSAADVVFKNIVFDGSSTAADGPTAMFTITAAGFKLIGCEVILADATEAATLVITGNADADRIKVIGNRFYGSTDTGCTAAIAFVGGATDDIEIAYNTFEGDFSEAAIHSASAVTGVNIHHNYIYNYNDDDHAIQFTADALGTISYNQLVTDAFATAMDPGACDVFETYWANDEVDDVLGVEVFTHEDGNVLWSATELASLEGEAVDALESFELDELLDDAVTTSLRTAVDDAAVMGYVLATTNVSTYNRTTDSLEALGTIGTGAERCVKRDAATLPATTSGTIFTIATGPVEITGIMGYVTVGLSQTTCNLKIKIDPTTGAETDICTNLDVTGDVAGTTYSVITSVGGAALQEATLGVDEGMGGFSILAPVGIIELETSGSPTGSVEWYVRYKPLAPGAVITAN